eukprot:2130639-Rhodomonas_salina.1
MHSLCLLVIVLCLLGRARGVPCALEHGAATFECGDGWGAWVRECAGEAACLEGRLAYPVPVAPGCRAAAG